MKTFPYFYHTHGLWFIRFCGVMLHAKDTRRHHVFFSERMGYGPRAITVFGWRVSVSLS